MLIVVAASVPVTAGVPVGVESDAREEDSAFETAAKITPDDANSTKFATRRSAGAAQHQWPVARGRHIEDRCKRQWRSLIVSVSP